MARRMSIAAAFVILTLVFGMARYGLDVAQATPQSQAAPATPQLPQRSMQDMMRMHEQMMADMKAGDAKLDALVKDMNAASGDAKVAAVAAVVNELVRQHKVMHEHMGQMHDQMMGGRGTMMRR